MGFALRDPTMAGISQYFPRLSNLGRARRRSQLLRSNSCPLVSFDDFLANEQTSALGEMVLRGLPCCHLDRLHVGCLSRRLCGAVGSAPFSDLAHEKTSTK